MSDNVPLWKAMLAAQLEMEHAAKDSKNPHLKNKYASLGSVLDTVKPILNKHGLVLTQYVMGVNQQMFPGSTALVTKITHAETGVSTEDNQIIPLPKSDPQGMGSAITYARRYGVKTMLGINEEDDDANSASGVGAAVVDKSSHKPEKPTDVVKPQPADPAKVAEMANKLGSTLGFKKNG